MKNIKNNKILIILLILGIIAVSCDGKEDASNVLSEVTYLPYIEVQGESSITLDCDTDEFIDEGAIASESGVEIDLETTIEGYYFGSSAIDTPDYYVVTYSATNVDGIPGAEFRDITWAPCNGDLTTSIAGLYTADIVRNGSVDPTYQDLSPVMIKDLGDGVYQLSDAIGGYYDFGRGYGHNYAGTGMTVTANDIPSNDFTHTDVIGVGLFGGDLSMTSFSVDATSGTINFTTEWSFGFTFEVTLTQIAQ